MDILGRLIWSVLRTPIKGALGETAVKAGAGLSLPSSVYRRYHDVTLPTAGGTSQIDHVFVSEFGVFVVETKNMNGWIYGTEKDRKWIQVFPGGQKYTFQNPLRQNYGHVKAIEDALAGIGLAKGIVKSVVVFVGEAEFKRDLPENVTVGFGAARYIRSFRTRVLTQEQVAENLHDDRVWPHEAVLGDGSPACQECTAQSQVHPAEMPPLRADNGA